MNSYMITFFDVLQFSITWKRLSQPYSLLLKVKMNKKGREDGRDRGKKGWSKAFVLGKYTNFRLYAVIITTGERVLFTPLDTPKTTFLPANCSIALQA